MLNHLATTFRKHTWSSLRTFIVGLLILSPVAQAALPDQRLMLTGRDGTPLEALLNLPDDAAATGNRYPAVLLISPWAVPYDAYRYPARALAQRGYVVVSLMLRGMGHSGGTLDLAGPKDQADVRSVLDWLTRHPSVDPTRLGMGGVSLGGTLALLVGARDERIKAVFDLSGWTDLGLAFRRSGTSPAAWMGILEFSARNFGRKSEELQELTRSLYAFETTVQQMAAFSAPRSPVGLVEVINKRHLPVLFQHNIEDTLFRLEDVLDFYGKLTVPKRLYVNDGEHAWAEYLDGERLNHGVWNRVYEWLEYYVNHDRRGDSSRGSANQVRLPLRNSPLEIRVDDLGALSTVTETWSLRPSRNNLMGDLLPSPTLNEPTLGLTLRSGRQNNVGMMTPVVGPVLRAHFRNKSWVKQLDQMDADRVAQFAMPPFQEDLYLVGSPRLSLWMIPRSHHVQLVAYLYQLDGTQQARPVVHGAVTFQDVPIGQPIKVELDLLTAAMRLPRGERLMLALGTYDEYYLAPKTSFSFDLLFDAEHPATLDIKRLTDFKGVVKP